MVKKKILSLDSSERILSESKRHSVGLYGIYLLTSVGVVGALFLLYLVVSTEDPLGLQLSDIALGSFFGALILLIVSIGYVAASVYRSNELIITNENIIQILQTSLFGRKVSQLNLSKIQDVSVTQSGVFSHFFGYGTIFIETAGEQTNYKFTYAPKPNNIAKLIVEAHEDYVSANGQVKGSI